jgi:hypothetical protein
VFASYTFFKQHVVLIARWMWLENNNRYKPTGLAKGAVVFIES